MTKRNPKQEGSNIFDCKPQCGPCPLNCDQCFYNRPGAFYVPIDEPHIPSMEEVGDGIMRVNSGHDSNIQRGMVIEATAKYKHRFFNTSIPRFDFPGPVVFTANRQEEERANYPTDVQPERGRAPYNLMYIRLRVSSTNLEHIENAVAAWACWGVPVVLTFMAYYDHEPAVPSDVQEAVGSQCYVWKQRHINSYWCATREFMAYVMRRMVRIDSRGVTMCGTLDSNYCRDCHNCEIYYWQTMRRMAEKQNAAV